MVIGSVKENYFQGAFGGRKSDGIAVYVLMDIILKGMKGGDNHN
jgi:hypothetical protein